MRTTRFSALALALVALVAAGCESDLDNDRTLTIGVLAPLDAGLTQFGRGIRNSVQLAVDEANDTGLVPGWRIEIIAVDDSSNPDIGRSNAQRLLDEPTVTGVVGTYNSGVAAAVAPDFAAAGITLISPGNTDPTLTRGPDRSRPVRPYASYFRMVAHDAQQGIVLAHAAAALGFEAVSVVTDEKPVSQGLATDFRNAFLGAGGDVRSFEVVPEGDTDYAPFAQRAAAAGPQLLFFGGEYDHAALLKHAAIAAGLRVPLMGGDGIQADEYIAATGPLSEGDLASSVGAPVAHEPADTGFLAAYNQRGFAEPPSNFGPYAYDAANILLSAAQRALADTDRVDDAVRTRIVAAVQDITNAALINARGAVTGAIGFDSFGDTINPVFTIYRVEDGQWIRATHAG